MKYFFFSIILIFHLSCKNIQSDKNKKQQDMVNIKVAAYNVEYSKNASATEIGEALKSYNFDIVCFSEAPGGSWTSEVGEILGLNNIAVGKYPTAGHLDKYKTIASRTLLYDVEEVLMADTLHTATKAKTLIGDTEFAVYAVHFPFGWRDQAHIDETTGKITAFVNFLKEKQKEEISVVAGDFNFRPSSPDNESIYYQMFVNIGMDNTWKKLGIDCTNKNTFDAMVPEDEGNGEVIDHVMYNISKLDVLDGGIIEMEKPLSDHKPVWALLQTKF